MLPHRHSEGPPALLDLQALADRLLAVLALFLLLLCTRQAAACPTDALGHQTPEAVIGPHLGVVTTLAAEHPGLAVLVSPLSEMAVLSSERNFKFGSFWR